MLFYKKLFIYLLFFYMYFIHSTVFFFTDCERLTDELTKKYGYVLEKIHSKMIDRTQMMWACSKQIVYRKRLYVIQWRKPPREIINESGAMHHQCIPHIWRSVINTDTYICFVSLLTVQNLKKNYLFSLFWLTVPTLMQPHFWIEPQVM